MISIFSKYISGLAFSDFNIGGIEVHSVVFSDGWTVDYTNGGRRQNLLHLMLCGERIYRVGGEEIKIEGQTLLFIPHGTAYSTTSHSRDGKQCAGIGISFDVLQNGESTALPHGVYEKRCCGKASELFFEIERAYREIPIRYSKLKSLILELISHLAEDENTELGMMIKPAIDLMADTFCKNLPVEFYARACNLSESYFRKIFKATLGISPIEYRNELRFKKAEQLYQKGVGVKEIAEEVGFCDEVFFSKLYKRRFGRSIKNRLKAV